MLRHSVVKMMIVVVAIMLSVVALHLDAVELKEGPAQAALPTTTTTSITAHDEHKAHRKLPPLVGLKAASAFFQIIYIHSPLYVTNPALDGVAFDEIIVESSLNIRPKPGPPSRRRQRRYAETEP